MNGYFFKFLCGVLSVINVFTNRASSYGVSSRYVRASFKYNCFNYFFVLCLIKYIFLLLFFVVFCVYVLMMFKIFLNELLCSVLNYIFCFIGVMCMCVLFLIVCVSVCVMFLYVLFLVKNFGMMMI